jgi:FtsH-binding integral membrane protein
MVATHRGSRGNFGTIWEKEMNMDSYPNTQRKPFELEYATDDKAVFNFFNAVYAWMFVGLAVTGTVAYFVSQSTSLVITLNSKGIVLALVLGLWALAWFIGKSAPHISVGVSTALFLVYSAAVGVVLSYVFLIYSLPTIGGAFVMTAGTFGAMSLYGFVTKRDLTSMGSILVMLAIGLFLGSLVNIFIASTAFSWFITYAVLVVFIGLTAYDTQKLKVVAERLQGNGKLAARYAIIGSLELYLDFINMFMSILRILGNRR